MHMDEQACAWLRCELAPTGLSSGGFGSLKLHARAVLVHAGNGVTCSRSHTRAPPCALQQWPGVTGSAHPSARAGCIRPCSAELDAAALVRRGRAGAAGNGSVGPARAGAALGRAHQRVCAAGGGCRRWAQRAHQRRHHGVRVGSQAGHAEVRTGRTVRNVPYRFGNRLDVPVRAATVFVWAKGAWLRRKWHAWHSHLALATACLCAEGLAACGTTRRPCLMQRHTY